MYNKSKKLTARALLGTFLWDARAKIEQYACLQHVQRT